MKLQQVQQEPKQVLSEEGPWLQSKNPENSDCGFVRVFYFSGFRVDP